MKKPAAPKPRGRPRAFDRSVALERATDLFARLGYEGASIAELTTAMGITPQSLYAAFGSKEALYREALDQFAQGAGSATARILNQESDVLVAFSAMFAEAASRFAAGDSPRGCMVASGALACADEHRGIVEHLAGLRARSLAVFEARLGRGVADGQLSTDTDMPSLARFLGAALQGMSVQARDGADENTLVEIGKIALQALSDRRT